MSGHGLLSFAKLQRPWGVLTLHALERFNERPGDANNQTRKHMGLGVKHRLSCRMLAQPYHMLASALLVLAPRLSRYLPFSQPDLDCRLRCQYFSVYPSFESFDPSSYPPVRIQCPFLMNSIRQIQVLNKRELEAGVSPEASWHADYRDTAYIYIGSLPFDLSEGDIITIFSQYGEPVFINLIRDKETGKSKGFGFLKYEDQRSTDLAVDNLGGATVMGRMLRVDHTRYKKKDDEDSGDNTMGDQNEDANIKSAKRDGGSESGFEERKKPVLKGELELQELMREYDDEDPMKAYLTQQKKEEIEAALARSERKSDRRNKKQSREPDGDNEDARYRRHRKERHRSRSHSSDYRAHRSRSGERECQHSPWGTRADRNDKFSSRERSRRRGRSESSDDWHAGPNSRERRR